MAVELRREEAARLEEWFRNAGLPRRARHVTLADSRSTAAIAAVRRWLAEQPSRCSTLGLHGPTGSGKTHALAAVLRELYSAGRAAEMAEVRAWQARKAIAPRPWACGVYAGARWIHGPAWVREVLNFRMQEDAWDTALSASVLVVDDLGLGADRVGEAYWDSLDELIAQRHADAAPVLYSTNLTVPALLDALGDRTADRLREWATLVECRGKSLREGRAP
jgi:DNA replication protein DnaC